MSTHPRRQQHGQGKPKARSSHTTMMPAGIRGDDEEYIRHVEKIEAVQESRGNYILGQGALDKNDSAFLLEEEEKRMVALKRKAISEKQMFAEMVAHSRRADLLERDRSEEEGLATAGPRAMGHARKRVKGRIALQAGIAAISEKKDVQNTHHHDSTTSSSCSVEREGAPPAGLPHGGLFAEYEDSEEEKEEKECIEDDTNTKTALPSALDVVS